jgi:hypothetical protein
MKDILKEKKVLPLKSQGYQYTNDGRLKRCDRNEKAAIIIYSL